MKHPYFGELSAALRNDVWEGTVELAGRAVPATLWLNRAATAQQLDAVAAILRQLVRFDAAARVALGQDLIDGESARMYIDHHLAELSDVERHRALGTATKLSDAQFLAAMVLGGVELHPENDDDEIAVLDYTLAADLTQYVLAVGFDVEGDVVSVAMES